jgi:hypothetical protein
MIGLRTMVMVHGNAVSPQFLGGAGLEYVADHRMDHVSGHPYTDIVGERQGPGVVFRGRGEDNSNFFHVAIPSPSAFPIFSPDGFHDEDGHSHHYFNVTAKLVNVYLDVTVDPGVFLASVFIFDGPQVLQHFTHTEHQRLFSLGETVLTSGLGVSFEVQWGSDGNITFHSVKAEFQLDNLP